MIDNNILINFAILWLFTFLGIVLIRLSLDIFNDKHIYEKIYYLLYENINFSEKEHPEELIQKIFKKFKEEKH